MYFISYNSSIVVWMNFDYYRIFLILIFDWVFGFVGWKGFIDSFWSSFSLCFIVGSVGLGGNRVLCWLN